MRIHDVHDFDARLASRELLSMGFTAVDDVSGELVGCAEDELFEALGHASDGMEIVIDEIATSWGPVFVFRDPARVSLRAAAEFVRQRRPS